MSDYQFKDSITTPKKNLEDLLSFLGIPQEYKECIRYSLLSGFNLDDIRNMAITKDEGRNSYKKDIISTIILVNKLIDIIVSAGNLRYKLDEHGKIEEQGSLGE
tara:strand:+ start:93 stop:404 length:312 start_codon:yes stop_codon:yes gene_type:complete